MIDAATHPVEFDPTSEAFFLDPSDIYRRLRDEAPAYHNQKWGFYALSRYHDVLQASRDIETFSSAHGTRLSDLLNPNYVPRSGLISMDPPEHDWMRKLVSRVFTPRAIAGMEGQIRSVITGFLDPLMDRDAFDVVAEFSARFPVHVISMILGVPTEDREQLRHWFDLILHREPGEANPSPAGVEAYNLAHAYFHDLAIERRRRPTGDMMSQLVESEVQREDGSTTRLTDDELSAFGVLLGGAGSETVTKLVASGVVLFHQHPDQWRKVLDDEAAIPGAVEEMLRYYPPAEYQGRFTRREVTLHGVTIPVGVPVLLLTRAACHDEREFPDPDRFDIGRDQHISLGFGHGIHSCLGAALARMESRISFEELRRRWPVFDVDLEGCVRVTASNVAGYSNVPVSVG